MTKQEELFISTGQQLKGAEQSQMFGKPCFKVKGKAFMCLFEGDMVFKLTGDMHVEALALKGAQLFDPSGRKRPMKEWVQIPYTHNSKWKKFAEAAMQYVKSNLK